MRRSRLTSCLVVGLAAITPRARAQVTHYDSRIRTSRGAVSNAALDANFQRMAVQYRAYAPVPRVAQCDMAFPADSAEYVAMHGYALLVVVAIDQDSAELPPARVYIAAGPSTVDLPLVTLQLSPVADTTVRAIFGNHRVDALYLLPVSLRSQGGQLLLDFAKNRQGFRLRLFDQPIPAENRPMLQLRTATDLPPIDVVWRMFQREYPDLARSFQADVPK